MKVDVDVVGDGEKTPSAPPASNGPPSGAAAEVRIQLQKYHFWCIGLILTIKSIIGQGIIHDWYMYLFVWPL